MRFEDNMLIASRLQIIGGQIRSCSCDVPSPLLGTVSYWKKCSVCIKIVCYYVKERRERGKIAFVASDVSISPWELCLRQTWTKEFTEICIFQRWKDSRVRYRHHKNVVFANFSSKNAESSFLLFRRNIGSRSKLNVMRSCHPETFSEPLPTEFRQRRNF